MAWELMVAEGWSMVDTPVEVEADQVDDLAAAKERRQAGFNRIEQQYAEVR
jgi:hypothetical protein